MKTVIFILVFLLLFLNSTGTLYAAPEEEPRIGLALSGGAAWGLAHIGVLEVFEEEGIDICCIAGTSAGAIVGSFYAGGMSSREMRKLAENISWRRFLWPVISELGLFSTERLEEFIDNHLQGNEFADLDIDFTCVASDLGSGELVVLNDGSVARAVAASSAIPVIFEPVEINDRHLVDGGLISNLPLEILEKKDDIDILIGVDVVSSFSFAEFPQSRIEVGIRSYNIMQQYHVDSEGADILIKPDLEGISGIDFESYKKMIARGREAAAEVIPEIKNWDRTD